MKKILSNRYFNLVISFVLIILLLFYCSSFFRKQENMNPDKEQDRVKTYIIQCYAGEGFYPPDLGYLKENYNLKLKEKDYDYFYDCFSSNIMPDILVNTKPGD